MTFFTPYVMHAVFSLALSVVFVLVVLINSFIYFVCLCAGYFLRVNSLNGVLKIGIVS